MYISKYSCKVLLRTGIGSIDHLLQDFGHGVPLGFGRGCHGVCCLLIRVVVLDPFLDGWCSKAYGEEYVYKYLDCSAQWSSRNRKTTTRTSTARVLEVFRDASREFPAQKPQLLKKHAILRVSHHKS